MCQLRKYERVLVSSAWLREESLLRRHLTGARNSSVGTADQLLLFLDSLRFSFASGGGNRCLIVATNSLAAADLITTASARFSRETPLKIAESCIVQRMIFVEGLSFRISRAASKPFITGIVISRITRSGRSS